MVDKVICNICNTSITKDQVRRRCALKYNFIRCPVCDNEISLDDKNDELIDIKKDSKKINYVSISSKDRTDSAILYNAKLRNKEYDAILIYDRFNKNDSDEVKRIARNLKKRGILPWLDAWETGGGESWEKSFDRVRNKINRAFLFIGNNNNLPWKQPVIDNLLRDFVKNGHLIIPILLQSCENPPELPIYLQDYGWGLVDLRTRNLNVDPVETILLTANGWNFRDSWSFSGPSEIDEDLEIIRKSISDTSINQFYTLSRAIIRILGIKEFKSINLDEMEKNTIFKIELPTLGLLRAKSAILLIRHKELEKDLRKDILDVIEKTESDLLFVVDIIDRSNSPSSIFQGKTIWFKTKSLWQIATHAGNKNKMLTRFILSHLDPSALDDFSPYTTEGYTKLFYGRDLELSDLIRKNDFPGGIIIGSHLSGKTSLLRVFQEKTIRILDKENNELKIFSTIINMGNKSDVNTFIKMTLNQIGIDATADTTLPEWSQLIPNYYAETGKIPIFLIDDANELIRLDIESNFELGRHIRALHYNGKCRFYLSGHDALRRSTKIQGSPYKNLCPIIILTGLKPLAASKLIKEPMEDLGFEINDIEIKTIRDGTAGVAVLIQDFCKRLLINISELYRKNSNIAIAEISSQFNKDLITEIENDSIFLQKVMDYFYEHAQTSEMKSIILLLSVKLESNRKELFEELKSNEMELTWSLFDKSLEFLLEYQILEEKDGKLKILPIYLTKALTRRNPIAMLHDEIKRSKSNYV